MGLLIQFESLTLNNSLIFLRYKFNLPNLPINLSTFDFNPYYRRKLFMAYMGVAVYVGKEIPMVLRLCVVVTTGLLSMAVWSGCALSLTPVVSGTPRPEAPVVTPSAVPTATAPQVVKVEIPADTTRVEITPGVAGAPPQITLSPTTPMAVAQLPLSDTFRLKATSETLDALQLELPLQIEGATATAATWYSSQPTVISVDAQGRARALANGEAEITAVVQQQRATLRLRVQQQPHSLKVTPSTLQALPNARHQLNGEVRDRLGHLLAEPALTWRVENSALAQVAATGLLTTTATAGTTNILVTAGSQQQRIALTVMATAPAGSSSGNLVIQPEF